MLSSVTAQSYQSTVLALKLHPSVFKPVKIKALHPGKC
jgi:hypothetical protein